MISIITKLGLVLAALSLASCGSYKTVYKPVSYKAPDMPYSGAVEYCTQAAQITYEEVNQRYNDQSKAEYLEKERIKLEEKKIRALNPSYTSTLNCTKVPYGINPTVKCTGGSAPNIGYVEPEFLKKRYMKPILSSHFAANDAKKRAFKNCMFEKGYKQVRVKKGESYSDTTSATKTVITSTAVNSRMKKAVLHLSGKGGVEKDFYKAFAIFEEEATEKNNPVAYFWLAAMYAGGKGVEQDKTKAREFGIKAARLGSLLARGSVLDDYIKGEDSGITLDQETAERWLKEVTDKRGSSDKDIEGAALRSKKFSKKIDKIIEWFEENDYSTSGVKLKASKTRVNKRKVYDASQCKLSPSWGKSYFCQDDLNTYAGMGAIISGKFYPEGMSVNNHLTSSPEIEDTDNDVYWGKKFFNKGKEYFQKQDYLNAVKWYKKSVERGYQEASSRLEEAQINLNQERKKWNKRESVVVSTPKSQKEPSISTTGNWKGTWISANGKDGGSANLTLIQSSDTLSGLFNIESSPCLKSGSIVGTVSDSDITMDITSGEHKIELFASNATSKSISGDYDTTQGNCKGSNGKIILLRDN